MPDCKPNRRTIYLGCFLCLWLCLGLFAKRGNAQSLPPELITPINKGVENLLHRRYEQAVETFNAISEQTQNDFYGHLGQMVVYQLQMFETNSFALAKEYNKSFQQAKKNLKLRSYKERGSSWYHFCYATTYGINGLFYARQEEWLKAINNGVDAILSVKKSVKYDPTFFDGLLGLGIYNYYRSVVTTMVKYLPFFKDSRAEGIAQIQKAQKDGKIVQDLAALALGFVYMAEGHEKRQQSLSIALELKNKYPENFIVRHLLGRIYRRLREYDKAINEYNELRSMNPQDDSVLYYLGLVYYYKGRSQTLANQFFSEFLETNGDKNLKARACYRLGRIAEQKKDYSKAQELYEQALKYDSGNALAKDRLKQLKKGKG